MALGLVGLLEVVEVDQQEGDRPGLGPDPGDLAVELLLERTVIAEPGQLVAEHLQACAVVGILEPVPGGVVCHWRASPSPMRIPATMLNAITQRQQGDRRPAQLGTGQGRDQQRCPDVQRGARAEPAHLDGATAARPPRRFWSASGVGHPIMALAPTALAPLYARTGNPAAVRRYGRVRVVAPRGVGAASISDTTFRPAPAGPSREEPRP